MEIRKRYNFLLGFLSASLLLCGVYFLIKPQKNHNNPYVILKSDYKIEGAGYIKKGTILRVDEGMSEGFTRFILYLNLKSGDYESYPGKENSIIPYWLNSP
jgi:hypothetical protein